MPSLTRQLVDLIDHKPVSDADLHISALFLLDAAANIIAGQNSDPGRKIGAWAKSIGLSQHATANDSARLAFVYGALCHILEMDDLHRASVVHPGCVVAPVVFALGAGGDGRKALTAFLKGVEATTRVGMAVGTEHYKIWHNTATCGPFGSAFAAAELLNLSSVQKVHALGNAGSQSSGLWQFLDTGAHTKHLHAGRGAEAGTVAAQLAAHDFTGAPDILEGNRGLFRATCTNPPVENLLDHANGPWQMHLNSIKPWPSCRHTHPAIAAALSLHAQLADASVQSGQIDQIVVETYQATLDLCDRSCPQSVYAAKFSLQHCIATALANGKVDLDSFDQHARSAAQPLAAKVSARTSKQLQSAYPAHWGCKVSLRLTDGKTLQHQTADAPGDPEAPLSRNQLIEKATGLLDHAGVEKPMQLVDQVLCMTTSGRVPDLSGYIACLRN